MLNTRTSARVFVILEVMQANNEDESSQKQDSKGPIKREQMYAELRKETSERMSRIDNDFSQGFEKIRQYSDTVTIFGSARFTEDHPYYQKARELGALLAQEGYTVITGGGGGIMEAGNRGAYENNGKSVGFNIQLPHEQNLNPYTTDSLAFRYFFSRKVLLDFAAEAYIFFPGGFGTLDEFFEILTLIQTGKAPAAPIIMVGTDFWNPLDDFIKEHLLEGHHTITPGDEKLYTITDDFEVIKQILSEHERVQLTELFSQ